MEENGVNCCRSQVSYYLNFRGSAMPRVRILSILCPGLRAPWLVASGARRPCGVLACRFPMMYPHRPKTCIALRPPAWIALRSTDKPPAMLWPLTRTNDELTGPHVWYVEPTRAATGDRRHFPSTAWHPATTRVRPHSVIDITQALRRHAIVHNRRQEQHYVAMVDGARCSS